VSKIMYRADRREWNQEPIISKRVIVKKTEKTVTFIKKDEYGKYKKFREVRQNLDSGDARWFDTFEEARQFLMGLASGRLEHAEKKFKAAQKFQEEITWKFPEERCLDKTNEHEEGLPWVEAQRKTKS